MDKVEGEKGSCCSGGGCGSCCGGKAVKALVLLLVGGILGYLLGGHCAYKKAMCPPSGMSMPMTPPQK